MQTSSFAKLGRVPNFTDYLVVGIETSRGKTDANIDAIFETIDRYCISHLRGRNGDLYEVEPLTEFEGNTPLATILEHYHLGRHTLLVCNNSLVFLGSSDLTALLESGIYEIAEGCEEQSDIGVEGKHRVSTRIFIASAPPTIVALRGTNTDSRITIVDIANYGVKRIGDLLCKLPKHELRSIPNHCELGLSIDKCDTITACMQLFIRKYYQVIVKHKFGGVALTYAGQSMRHYRRNHYDGSIEKHANESAATIEERAYIGGRCEARYRGWYRGRCYLLDVNSLYPAIGRVSIFPRRLLESYTHPTNSRIENVVKTHGCIAHCRINTDQPAYPAKVDGVLSFPIGRFNTYLCGDELKYALKKGHVQEVYHACSYDMGLIVKSYSEDMLSIRSEYKESRDIIKETIVKHITNGLWGYFGQQGNRWVIDDKKIATCQYGGFVSIDERDESKQYWRVIKGQCSKLCRSFWLDNTFTPVSAYVNSYARHLIWQWMIRAGLNNVLYCCIDGFIVTEEGYQNLRELISNDPYDYGLMKVVEKDDSCYIHSAGRYRIGNKIAYAGLSSHNDYIYRGFWNIRDEKYIIDQITFASRTNVIRKVSRTDLRGKLGRDDCDEGAFTSPIVAWDQKLNGSVEYRREQYPQLSFDHFRQ